MAFDYFKYNGFNEVDSDLSILIDKGGRQRTQSLFKEAIGYVVKKKGELIPIYTMCDKEKDGLPSAYQIYMHSIDEYEAAMKLVGSMRHWRKLCKLSWFMKGVQGVYEGLEQWREDMMLRDASTSKGVLMRSATLGKDSSAARKILDMSTPKDKKSVGRPKKPELEEVEEEDQELLALHERLTSGAE